MRNEDVRGHMKGTMVEHRYGRNVKGKYSTGSRYGTCVKKGRELDEGDWVRQKGTKDVGNLRCGVEEFRGGVRG